MTSNRKLQFSLSTLFLVTFCVAVVSLFVKQHLERRVDFVDPPPLPSSGQLTQSDIDELTINTMEDRTAFLATFQKDHPPCGIEYWQHKAGIVEQGMTTHALFKYIPPASASGSWLIPRDKGETTQVYYYAVDSQFAVLSEMTAISSTQSHRVVRIIGFFPHNLKFTDGGTLNLTNLDITNHSEPIVNFEE